MKYCYTYVLDLIDICKICQNQWISDRSKFLANSLITVLDCVENSVTPVLCQYFMSIVHEKYEKSYMNFGFLGDKCDMIVTESGVN
jgi:hypothetical protein